jgi:hypothetical protein
MDMKFCTKCNKMKSITFFKKGTNSGFQCWCIECNAIYQKEHYKNHRNDYIKRAKTWSENNRSKSNASKNKWKQNNLDRCTEIQKNYRKANKPRHAVHEQIRRSKKRNLPSTLTPNEWEEIKIKWNYTCAYCGCNCNPTQDHIIPLIQDGAYTKDNIVPACKSCNCRKQGRTPEQSKMQLLIPK